ncbi:MAG: hypothetical protein WC617_20370 [Rhodanobacter sp.]|jgi:small lipoprotein (TIGR04454 family)
MKQVTLAALMVVSVAGCSSKPLTEAECRTVANKEIEFATSKAPSGAAEDLRDFLAKRADENNPQCMAGKTYSRSDYRCMVRANDPDSIGKCIAKVSKRLGH